MVSDFFPTVSGNVDYDLMYFTGLFITGCLFGFTICSFSCIPIVCTVVMGTRRGFKNGFASTVTFSAGRVLGYTVAGILCGLTGMAAENLFQQQYIILTAAILFLLTGGSIAFFPGKKKCQQDIGQICQTKNPKLRMSSLGLITGMMPCVPYTAVMASAAASGSPVTGGLSAFCFGLGTSVSPLLLIGGGAGWFSKKILEKTPEIDGMLRKITGCIIMVMGIRMLIG